MNLDDNGSENGNGWVQWRRHIILELQRLNTTLEKLEERNTEHILKFSNEISRIKVWIGIFAVVLGTTATIVLKEVILKW